MQVSGCWRLFATSRIALARTPCTGIARLAPLLLSLVLLVGCGGVAGHRLYSTKRLLLSRYYDAGGPTAAAAAANVAAGGGGDGRVGGGAEIVRQLTEPPRDAAMRPPSHAAILYGVMTTNTPVYRQKLLAQLETWAAGLPAAGRFVAVTGRSRVAGHAQHNGKHGVNTSMVDLSSEHVEGLHVSECEDSRRGISCKEERLIELGYTHKADWLVILGEDNYVSVPALEAKLETVGRQTPRDEPKVLGIVGCFVSTSYCGDVLSKPKAGLCGGGGYAINRAALERLMSHGQDALRQEYLTRAGRPGDMVTSCALFRRGISLTKTDGLLGNRIMMRSKFLKVIKKRPLTYHYLEPGTMRWVHAMLSSAPSEKVQRLQKGAFRDDCCCWFNTKQRDKCKKDALKSKPQQSSSLLETENDIDGADSSLLAELRDEYIAERQAVDAESPAAH